MLHFIANKTLAGTLIAISAGGIPVQPNTKVGYLVGSMVYVDERQTESLGEAAHVTVELIYKRQIVKLISNDHGDYVVTLPAGKYCLKTATGSDGRLINFSRDQHRCFKITSAKDMRFDVMLLKP
jgi:hypothetical protein